MAAWFCEVAFSVEFILAGENFIVEIFLFLELAPNNTFGLTFIVRELTSLLLLRGGTSLSDTSHCSVSSSFWFAGGPPEGLKLFERRGS